MRADAKHAAWLGSLYLPASAWSAQDKQTHSWTIRSRGSHRVNRHLHKHQYTHTPVNINVAWHKASKQAVNAECPVSASHCHRAKLHRFTSDKSQLHSNQLRNWSKHSWKGLSFFSQSISVLGLFFWRPAGRGYTHQSVLCSLFKREHATQGKSLHVSHDMLELTAE